MPIYTYQCRCGREFDVTHKISRVPKKHRCSCGWMARRVIALNSIQCDSVHDVKWLPSACEVLLKQGERPLQSRSEYNAYLKKNHLVCKG
jgi:putative FmdB family regulatory protein